MADLLPASRRPRDETAAAGERHDLFGRFAPRVFLVAGVAVALLVLWRLAPVALIAFGGVLLAVALRVVADAIEDHTPLHRDLAFVAAVLLVASILGVVAYLIGGTLVGQLEALWTNLPQLLEQFRGWLEAGALGRAALESFESVDGMASAQRIAGFAAATMGAAGNLVVVLILGVYLAADPGVYRRGTLRLVPDAVRPRVAAALSECGRQLRKWLVGQLVAMLAIAAVTALGLWALGIPYAVALAVIAGLLEFVPFLGPIAAAVPAVLVGFSQSPETALYVALLYFVIQQLEGHLLTPLVQRWAVAMPPALAVLAVIVFGVLFGIPGVLFAVPLMVVAMVLVEKLYLEGVLDR